DLVRWQKPLADEKLTKLIANPPELFVALRAVKEQSQGRRQCVASPRPAVETVFFELPAGGQVDETLDPAEEAGAGGLQAVRDLALDGAGHWHPCRGCIPATT